MNPVTTETPQVRWRAGTRLRQITGPVAVPLVLWRPVMYGDHYAEVQYAGATGTHLMHTAFLDIR